MLFFLLIEFRVGVTLQQFFGCDYNYVTFFISKFHQSKTLAQCLFCVIKLADGLQDLSKQLEDSRLAV